MRTLPDPNPESGTAPSVARLRGAAGFFREPEVFQKLEGAIIPLILSGRSGRDPVRVWVPCCSTGEQVYSAAICLLEGINARTEAISLQIFGTDTNAKAIEYARTGIYPESSLGGVSEERLRRFFAA